MPNSAAAPGAGPLRRLQLPGDERRSVLDPVGYAGALLRMQLEANGIRVEGGIRKGILPADAKLLLAFEGRPIAEIVRLFMKHSNNVIAESLLKNLAAHEGSRPATWEQGRAVARRELEKLGLPLAGAALVVAAVRLWQRKRSGATVCGLLALAANGAVLMLLWRHRADDLNMRSVWLCSRNDVMANAAVLLTEVLYLKQSQGRQFVVVDAGMNDLIRPGLYGAYHDIVPVETSEREDFVADIVGPVCETTDFLARDRALPQVQRGEILAVKDAGAYGFTLASNYNSRPRAAEVLVDSQSYQIVRKRESYEDLVRGEKGF